MFTFIFNLAIIAVLGVIGIRYGKDRRVAEVRSARWLRIAGVVLLGLQVFIAGMLVVDDHPLVRDGLRLFLTYPPGMI